MLAIIFTVFIISMIVSLMISYVYFHNSKVKEINQNHTASQMIHMQALHDTLQSLNIPEQDKIKLVKTYLLNFSYNINHKQFYNLAKEINK